ncbi:thermonuclease family protein [Novosphingobium resinovorum]|uniref:Nuclease n=1 Tax=Novosphingobium resinovorum TaxID=158500 RepID=A0A1D8ACL2_9SPHN|nr:thermonuclease family protein [Novosphingobium resinovorum]AOR79850.1 nuclease [Novosphingobium resinovorum]
MSLLLFAAAAGLCVANVHDGDTLTLCNREKVRIANIDAPELRDSPRCAPQQRQRFAGSRNPAWCDYGAGEQSREALRSLLANGRVTIERLGQDRYGRTLAQIYVGDQDAGEYLIARGLARPWRN